MIRKAQRLDPELCALALQQAQVHATLALVAITALAAGKWAEVIVEPPSPE
jgi:hypothetical protein